MKIELYVIDHRGNDDEQIPGKIIASYFHEEHPLGQRYADYNALYAVWTDEYRIGPPPAIVGFMGYRKYICFGQALDWEDPNIRQGHAPGWYNCSRPVFDYYRGWLAKWDGAEILPMLAQHDIIVTPPFLLGDLDIIEDFAFSRSNGDAIVLDDVTHAHSLPTSNQITPYLFITRWSVFNRIMTELEEIRQDLDPLILAADSADEAYKKRPMAYVMERVFSLWLEQSELSTYTLPLLNCWELQ